MSCGSTTCHSTIYLETPPFQDIGRSWDIPIAWLERLALDWGRWHQRRQLAELDDRLLDDIGVSRQQAAEEALKSSWMRIMMWPVQ